MKRKNKDLDIYAIQGDRRDLETVLSNVKVVSDSNILFTNVQCHFTVNNKKINVLNFDTMFYSEANDSLILLLKNGAVSVDEFIQALINRNIPFTEVTLKSFVNNDNEGTVPETWIARDMEVLRLALNDTIVKKGPRYAEYYPDLISKLQFEYGYEQGYDDVLNRHLDGRNFKGVLQLPDKLVLLVNSPSISREEVYKVLLEAHFTVGINRDNSSIPNFFTTKENHTR